MQHKYNVNDNLSFYYYLLVFDVVLWILFASVKETAILTKVSWKKSAAFWPVLSEKCYNQQVTTYQHVRLHVRFMYLA